jgi:hypothetical protein
MQNILTLWPIYAPGAFFAALAVGMIRLEEFKKARAFFWFSAILLSVFDIAWQFTTPAPFWFRAVNGTLVTILVFLVFPKVLTWLKDRENGARLER